MRAMLLKVSMNNTVLLTLGATLYYRSLELIHLVQLELDTYYQ